MPVNYQQALQQIREMGEKAPLQEEKQQALRAQARALFGQHACMLDSLEQLVDRAAVENPSLRCAAPAPGATGQSDCLDSRTPAPPFTGGCILLAADGSQINPDRHAAVEYGAINVGAIRMQPGMGQAPVERVQSTLLFNDDLYTASGNPLTEDLVALRRDLAEREVLAEMAKAEAPPVITLTDGPLELFREPKNMPEFEEKLARYKDVLEALADMGAVTAGYVDRPRSDLLVRLLELVMLQRNDRLHLAGIERPLRGVSDASLFLELLDPGERSAVFAIQSDAARSFQGRLALHFFYLNVGRPSAPYLSRVEIPRWVAKNDALVNLLHGALVAQAHHLGARPYPYLLHRAHEIAVVSFDERDQLENMIVAELRRQGIQVGDRSNKQLAKSASAGPAGAIHPRSR